MQLYNVRLTSSDSCTFTIQSSLSYDVEYQDIMYNSANNVFKN